MQVSNHKHASLPVIETFYLLDFDRCLGNTDALQACLQRIIERETGIDPDTIRAARREFEQSGGSFDTATYVKGLFDVSGRDGEVTWRRIKSLFITEARRQDMLEPGAVALLKLLRRRGAAFGVITYGSMLWQTTKMQGAGLDDVPHIVTSVKEKGGTIASWQLADGSFLIPAELTGAVGAVIARSIVFLDDKPVSFRGLPPDGVKGLCVLSPGVTWPKEALDGLPDAVTVVKGLDSATELLFGH